MLHPLVSRASVVGLAAATVAAILVGSATPTHALSCAPHPDGAPRSIAAGTEVLASGRPFFEVHDYAVVGTVTDIRTDERQGSHTYGTTEIDVRVAGVLGIATAPATITLRAPDPGWMAGYPFEQGASYFIPVVALSPDGVVNHTHGCDPVGVVDDPVAEAADLRALAGSAGIDFGTPGAPGPGPGDGRADGSGRSWFVPAASAAAVLAAAGSLVVLWRRPLRPGSDLIVVGGGDEGVEGRRGPA